MLLAMRVAFLCLVTCVTAVSLQAQQSAAPGGSPAATAPAASGKEVLQRKCFQCHQATMWSSLRHDQKAWQGVLYRMVGRGALWTEAEINAMAAFLAETRGLK
jgi:cytochrome c5